MLSQQKSLDEPVLRHRYTALDGVRALAAVGVVLDHLQVFNAGWTGVDLFFVLSGFLITSILRRTRDDQSYYSEFWIKRVTRIMPPLLITLSALVLLQSMQLRWALICLLTGGDVTALYMKPFLPAASPLWSLAVEEHFYFLWPFAVRFLPGRALVVLLGLLITGEPLLRTIYTTTVHPSWDTIYFLTQFRLDGLAMGALLSICFERPRIKEAISQSSMSMILVTGAVFVGLRVVLGLRFTREGNTSIYNGLSYTLVAMTAFWCVSYLLTHTKSVTARVLSSQPLVWIGQISYGLYLYHTIIFVVLQQRVHLGLHIELAITLLLSVSVSAASFRFIERPMIAWGRRKSAEYRRSAGFAPPAKA